MDNVVSGCHTETDCVDYFVTSRVVMGSARPRHTVVCRAAQEAGA